MPRACREYITLKASTVPVENLRACWAITDDLQRVVAGKKIGWKAVPLCSSADIENEWLDEPEILAASGGRLPVIFVNVTFHTEETSGVDLADWEARFGLVLLGEHVQRF